MLTKRKVLAHGNALLPMLKRVPRDTPERVEPLTIELLDRIASEMLPAGNRGTRENFEGLYGEMRRGLPGELTAETVRSIIRKNLGYALSNDRDMASRELRAYENVKGYSFRGGMPIVPDSSDDGYRRKRREAGVYFTHVGLIRVMYYRHMHSWSFHIGR